MLSGSLNLSGQANFDGLFPAHPDFIDMGRVETPDSHVLLVVERDQSQPYLAENFYGQHISAPEIHAIEQKILSWPLQSLIITITKNTGSVVVERNNHATCPLYLLKASDTLQLNWDPVELYRHLSSKTPLNLPACGAFIMMNWMYGPETIFKDILLLPERGRATITQQSIHIGRPDNIARLNPVPLKPGTDPIHVFYELLKDNIKRWDISDHKTFAELSSGLDTTIVTHALSDVLGHPSLQTVGYIPMGEYAEDIKQRRLETIKQLGLKDHSHSIARNLDAAFDNNHTTWPYETPTAFEKIHMAKYVAQTGGNLVFTGIGGDELCALTDVEKNRRPFAGAARANDDIASFSLLTDKLLQEMWEHETPPWPNGIVPESCPDMANSSATIYLREGVWCAHPLALSVLQMFAHFLPTEWRKNRYLSKAVLAKLGYSDNFLHQTPKESLRETMAALALRIDWQQELQHSILIDAGIIDRDHLQQAIDLVVKTNHPKLQSRLMAALKLERSLQGAFNYKRLRQTA